MGKEHVIIEWLKPESDGGSELKNYIVDKREKSSTRWGRLHEHICSYLIFALTHVFTDLESLFVCGPGGHGSTRPTPSMTPV